VARQLADTRPGYALYRFIAGHNIAIVLAPLSPTAFQDISAYNEGRDNDWILPPTNWPDASGTAVFLRANNARYFILSSAANPPARAQSLLARLKPGAVLMLRDPSGMELYRIDPAVMR
jgi:hypothetical protein